MPCRRLSRVMPSPADLLSTLHSLLYMSLSITQLLGYAAQMERTSQACSCMCVHGIGFALRCWLCSACADVMMGHVCARDWYGTRTCSCCSCSGTVLSMAVSMDVPPTKPIWRHATSASTASKALEQTAPNAPFKKTCSAPVTKPLTSTRLTILRSPSSATMIRDFDQLNDHVSNCACKCCWECNRNCPDERPRSLL